ncbi:GNAT family N-acetyltransferase [Pedobacter frigiditerrae]|uniref:GNAT family N-acetyltransferase n=1 Tax=Pedobacter frigiditerrae TaxID=2530452 RepID=A0A4R0N3A9_9SPHI|nr:GNAT family N-acetyltransferase [Pedobacter frigiditerrae]TCC94331.1 GNAT family N-acetyltransferase [Pedobacter frigiditerrae]
MPHLLDNPIYNALSSAHHPISLGSKVVKYYFPSFASFAGLKDNSTANFEELYQISEPESFFIVFSIKALEISNQWKLIREINMFQLVYGHQTVPTGDESEFVDLNETHVDEMIALVQLTEPGPFLEKTIDFGNYTGIFENGKLVSMAGHRFNPTPYTEVSAVCTHPNHLGKGYAYNLLREQIKRILAKNEIPFLHVRDDNEGAIKLYQKLGFKIRTSMIAYVIKKA